MARTGNSFSDYKPQNIGELIGYTTPMLPSVPRPPEQACDTITTIMIIVVMVVVTYYSGGAASEAFGSQFLGGFVGGVTGSVMSQGAATAMGVQEDVSLKDAFVAGVTTGISYGAGSYLAESGQTVGGFATNSSDGLTAYGAALQAGATTLGGAVASKLVGKPSGFSWRNMAASMGTAALGNAMGLSDPSNPAFRHTVSGILFDTFSGIVRAGISQGIKRALGDTESHFNFRDTALDAFGNALANVLGVGADRGYIFE